MSHDVSIFSVNKLKNKVKNNTKNFVIPVFLSLSNQIFCIF
ncbi:hypothetical protein FDUTEX481_08686 [Tolypothrix sp. PCC 7601]|nr:hypothetical protein FDUTEX481_08686 [Tolypothrix sp. PCC 7601]